MTALDKSIQNESRHAVYLQRFSGGLSNEIDPFLDKLKKEINNALMDIDITITRGHKLTRILRELEAMQKGIYSEYNELLTEQLELFAQHEIDFELSSIESVIAKGSVELSAPAVAQVWAAAVTEPLVFPDSNDTVMLKSFIKDWSTAQINKVSNMITTGFVMGDTPATIARRITGKGGYIDKTVRARNKTIVRTAVSHISFTARDKVMRDNDDVVIGYEWVSTLDGKTSDICKSLDGKIFYYKDGGYQPRLPQHPNERSSTAPVVAEEYRIDESNLKRASRMDNNGKAVDSKYTYYSLLKEQSDDYIIDTLGKTRGKLFINGGLTSKEFANLTTDQKFRPLTLVEMKKKDPQAFDKAGL